MRRRSTAGFSPELRDRYYFIDYLRLHRFGKQNGIWKKNRNMLCKEDEYSRSAETRSRKGYKSYIQRCMKSILDWMYPVQVDEQGNKLPSKGFAIIKPRNRFSYEIGKKNGANNNSYLDIVNDDEDKVKFIIQRYLTTGEYADLVGEYRDAVSGSPVLSFKNNESGLMLNLDDNRSFGYPAIKDLMKVKKCQDAMIAKVNERDQLLSSLVATGLNKCKILTHGTRVELLGTDGRLTGQYGTVISQRLEAGYRGTENRVTIDLANGTRPVEHYPDQFRVLTGDVLAQTGTPEQRENRRGPLIERVIEYANANFSNTNGINSDAIFRLARQVIVRELASSGDMESAGELRRFEPTSDILRRINAGHEVINEEEEEYEEVEYCEVCDLEIDDCQCCMDCNNYPCECEEYLEEEVEEWNDEVA